MAESASGSASSATPFTIVGAGLAGPLMAVYLARAGHPVELYEKRPDPRAGDADAGRSINLALSTRGIHALEQVGAAEAVMKTVTPMYGRLMHDRDGSLTYQPYGTEAGQAINSVSRLGLNIELLNLAESHPHVRIHFDRTCVGVDLDTGDYRMRSGGDGAIETVRAAHVIAADGAFSAVRGAMQHREHFNYDQLYLEHGYKELTIPPGPDGRHRIRNDVLHIWPRGQFMMIALPNRDGSFTCTLFWPFEGPNSFAALKDRGDILAFFEKTFPDAVPLIPDLVDQYATNPSSALCTIRCFPWHHRDRAVLLGDAAHAVVPFYGQGMNASFEDCHVLAACLDRHGADLEKAFEEYGRLRKENCDALRDLALENFIEMRDRVASRYFLFKKQLGKVMHKAFPKAFVPLYSMVTFSNLPYAEAVRRAERQGRILFALAVGLVFVLFQVLLILFVVLAYRGAS
jgi:kynurenine 3-monooxygenase